MTGKYYRWFVFALVIGMILTMTQGALGEDANAAASAETETVNGEALAEEPAKEEYVPKFPSFNYREEDLVVFGSMVCYFDRFNCEWEVIGHEGNPVSLVIPEQINGYPITVVWGGSFANCTSLETVEIREQADWLWIDSGAFYGCTNLKTVTAAADIHIGMDAKTFAGCTALEELVVPGETNLAGIGDFCPALKKITYHAPTGGVVEIAEEAFCGMTMLESVEIQSAEESVPYGQIERIGDRAFEGCTALKSVNAQCVRENIGISAFAGCTALENMLCAPQIGEEAYAGCTALTEAEIVKAVETAVQETEADAQTTENAIGIGNAAFRGCENITVVKIEEGAIDKLPSACFAGCKNLVAAEIPASVTEIAEDAFEGCENVTFYAAAGSAAEEFARTQGYACVTDAE